MTTSTSAKREVSIELVDLNVYGKIKSSPEERTEQVAEKTFAEKTLDVLSLVIGEYPTSGTLHVELMQYAQNSCTSHLGGHCHIFAS